MINAPNDIWAVVESSISAFLVVTIDDAVLYCMLQHPQVMHAVEALGTRPRFDKERAREQAEEEAGLPLPPINSCKTETSTE